MKKMRFILFSSILAILFSACGGSSSGHKLIVPVESIIEGIAIDEPIVNGIITAYKSPNNTKITSIRTDDNGSYSIKVKDYLGVVVIEVTCDKDSKLKTNNGTLKSCPLDTRLRTMTLTSGRATSLIAHISPLTEIAYQRAKVLSGGSADISISAFEQARTEIGETFGVDPINDFPNKGTYNGIIDSIHDVADDNNKSFQEIVDEFAQDSNDGSVSSIVSKDIAKAISTNNISNNLTKNNGEYTPSSNISNIDNNTTTTNDNQDTTYPQVSHMEAIAKAKEMFNNLRTKTLSIVDYKTPNKDGILDVEIQNFSNALNKFSIYGDTASIYKNYILNVIFDAIKLGKTEMSDIIGEGAGFNIKVTKESATTWSYNFGKNDIYNGTVIVPTDNPNIYIDSNNYSELNFDFDGTLPKYRLIHINQYDDVSEYKIQKLTAKIVVNKLNDSEIPYFISAWSEENRSLEVKITIL